MEAVAGSFAVRRAATIFALQALLLATAAQHKHLATNSLLEDHDTSTSPLDTTLAESSGTVFALVSGLHARQQPVADEPRETTVSMTTDRDPGILSYDASCTGAGDDNQQCSSGNVGNSTDLSALLSIVVPSNYLTNFSQTKFSGASPMGGKVEDNDHAVDGRLHSIPVSSPDVFVVPDAPVTHDTSDSSVAHDTPDAPDDLIDHDIQDVTVARDILDVRGDLEAPDVPDVLNDRNTPYSLAHDTTAAPDATTAHDTPDVTIVHDATVAQDTSNSSGSLDDPEAPDAPVAPRADVTPEAPDTPDTSIALDWPDIHSLVVPATPDGSVDHDASMACNSYDDSNVPNYPDLFEVLYVPEIPHAPDVSHISQPLNSPYISCATHESHVLHVPHAPLAPDVNNGIEDPDNPFVPNIPCFPDLPNFLYATSDPIAQNTPDTPFDLAASIAHDTPVVPATLDTSKLYPTSVLIVPHGPRSPDIIGEPETPNISISPDDDLKIPEISSALRSDLQPTTGNTPPQGDGVPCFNNELRVNRIIMFNIMFPSEISGFVYVRCWLNLFKNKIAGRRGTMRSPILSFSPFEETGMLEMENSLIHEETGVLEMEDSFLQEETGILEMNHLFLINVLKPNAEPLFGLEVRPSKKTVDKISLATVVSVDKQSDRNVINPEAMILGHQYIRESDPERRSWPAHSRLLIERLKAASRTGSAQGSLRVKRKRRGYRRLL